MISGNIDHGKDFLADLMLLDLKVFGIKAEKISTAKEMKRQLCYLFNITPEFLDFHKNEKTPITLPDGQFIFNFRTFIQNYGTLLRETIDSNIWANCLMNDINNSDAKVVIVPDLRYPYEWNTIRKKFNTTTVKIFNNDIPVDRSHHSETSMEGFGFDYYVDNTGRPKSIVQDSNKILKEILNG